MRKKKCLMALGALIALTLAAAAQQTVSAIYNFGNANGAYPHGGLAFDSHGNIFGTATSGGFFNQGVVFELQPESGGSWSGRTIYNFGNIANDGAYPYASLVADSAGNVYGTTSAGGVYGGGTVFELIPNSRGNYNETILHNFGSGSDGKTLYSNLIFDSSGNLYGTTYSGGTGNGGTVFELTPAQNDAWTETILINFGSEGSPSNLYSGLIFDSSGNLFGTSVFGGAHGGGTVFELSRTDRGNWKETTLFPLGGFEDGRFPYGGLAFDSAGNLYGTTTGGLAWPWNGGTIFELTPQSDGQWTETILTRVGVGSGPVYGGLINVQGDIYGPLYDVTEIFQMSPKSGGGWTFHDYGVYNSPPDGLHPYAGVIVDSSGNIYGTDLFGGTHGYGTVFKITP